jgi:ribose 5-phosphate isomerase RpiB
MIEHGSEIKSILLKYLERGFETRDTALRNKACDMAIDYREKQEAGARLVSPVLNAIELEGVKFGMFVKGMEYGLCVAADVVDHLRCMNCGEPDYEPTGEEFEEAVSEYLSALGGE